MTNLDYYLKFDENGEVPKDRRIPAPCILYNDSIMDSKEKSAMKKHFASHTSRMLVHGGELVIGRYSTFPNYKELETDLAYKGAKLINSFSQYEYVTDLQNWVHDLGDLTIPAYSFEREFYYLKEGAYIVKGASTSKKDRWNTHCFAKNKKEAARIAMDLLSDSMIGQQSIYLRPYVPLETLMIGMNEIPVSKEFRVFVAYGEILSSGFYWSNYTNELEKVPNPSEIPTEFLKKAIDRVKDKINFFSIDLALCKSGDWIIIELNEGSRSGLSENDPNILYKNLKRMTWDRYAGINMNG